MTAVAEHLLLSHIYRFLGRLLVYPDPAWIEEGHLDILSELLVQLGWDTPLLGQESRTSDSSATLETLRIEYTRLFINGVPAAIAPPYGSVHISGGGQLNSSFTEKVRKFYRDYGFDLAVSTDLADYLPLELEFLALLSESEDGTAREKFLDECFRPWFERFRERVQQGAALPFYGIVVELINFFTTKEGKYEH